MEEVDWSTQSPDLNPIKHIWYELEQRLSTSPSCPTSVLEFMKALQIEGPQIPTETLAESLSRRVEAVIAAKKGSTTY